MIRWCAGFLFLVGIVCIFLGLESGSVIVTAGLILVIADVTQSKRKKKNDRILKNN
jgi:hypothetical protein